MRVGIIGLGNVGTSVAVSVLQSGVATELLLHDTDAARAEGEAMDLAHGAPFYPHAQVHTAAIEDMLDADAVVIAVGKGGTSAERSRLDLLVDNARDLKGIGEGLRGSRGIIIVVSNPVDILTEVVANASCLPPERVMGTGTMLDTARLRQIVGAHLRLNARSINALVVGEHGDSEVPLWSCASVGGRSLREWPEWSQEIERDISEQVRCAAYEIVQRKGTSNHAIGLVTAALLRWILRGERRLLTVSRVQEGAFGIRDVALSLPCIVGSSGAVEVVEPSITTEERSALEHSAEVLRAARATMAI